MTRSRRSSTLCPVAGALAGLANNTVIFCLPGSTSACKTGWEKILKSQLDSSYRPCNFVGVLRTRRG